MPSSKTTCYLNETELKNTCRQAVVDRSKLIDDEKERKNPTLLVNEQKKLDKTLLYLGILEEKDTNAILMQ